MERRTEVYVGPGLLDSWGRVHSYSIGIMIYSAVASGAAWTG